MPQAPSTSRLTASPPRPALRAGGRFMLSDGIEHRCQTLEISASGAALRAPVRGFIGEHVICYLERYGRVEGHIVRVTEDGFAVDFVAPAAKRERLARELAQQAADPASDRSEERRHERLEPARTRIVLRLADGRHIAAQIINLSRSGAALTCPIALAVGDAVMVGRRPAHVARITQRLVGVAFTTPITADEFTTAIVL